MKNLNSNFAALCGLALLGTVLSLSSCSNDPEEVLNPLNNENVEYAPVRVHVSDFSYSVEDLPETRSTQSPASYENVKVMTLAFFSGTTEIYSETQLKSDASTYNTFGDFTCTLPIGSYTMVVIGRDAGTGNSDVFTLTSPTLAAYTSEKVRETFTKTQTVTIAGTAPVDLGEITLDRVVSQLGIISTDTRPANAAKIRTTFGGGSKSFSPASGLAVNDAGFATLSTPSADVGETIGVKNYLFLATDEETMDVTIEVLDANDEVLYTKLVENVPFKRNRLTRLTGALFNATLTTSFNLETTWLSAVDVPF
jgi:hypothetical protein